MDPENYENVTQRGKKYRRKNKTMANTASSSVKEIQSLPTPSRKTVATAEEQRTPTSVFKQKTAIEQTPRRSTRKSYMPVQDYDEIVSGVTTRSTSKALMNTDIESSDENLEPQPKWTPAKVGRVSQKRSTRRVKSGKKTHLTKESESTEAETESLIDTTEEKDAKSSNSLESKNDQLDSTILIESTKEIVKTEELNEEVVGLELLEMGLASITTEEKDTKSSHSLESKNVQQDTTVCVEITKDVVKNEELMEQVVDLELLEMGVAPIIYESDEDVDVLKIKKTLEHKKFDMENVSFKDDVKNEKVGIEIDNNEGTEEKDTAIEIREDAVESTDNHDILISTEQNDGNETFEKKDVEKTIKESSENRTLEEEEENEMPSLIFCDEDDEVEIKEENNAIETDKANDTFNASDCIVLSPPKEREKPLLVVESPMHSPLVDAELKVKRIQSKYFSPKVKFEVKVLDNKSLNSSTAAVINTPRSTKSLKKYRFPTPYKMKNNLSSNCLDETSKNKETETGTFLTNLEPKDIILRSIRKRSHSTSADGEQLKRRALNVTFYSPANQTVTTANVDEMLAKSATKVIKNKRLELPVLQRKRSISLDEDILHKSSKIPRSVNTLTKYRDLHQNASTKRTKLPNFAAIHQKQFKKMENLVDYVARKAERAQNLTTSTSKISANKSPYKAKAAAAKALNLHLPVPVKIALPVPQPLKPTNASRIESKTDARRQRHVTMFKGRTDPQTETKRTNQNIIRGVRSNRRFELMMQHRKTSGN